jgi:hypothetical protein
LDLRDFFTLFLHIVAYIVLHFPFLGFPLFLLVFEIFAEVLRLFGFLLELLLDLRLLFSEVVAVADEFLDGQFELNNLCLFGVEQLLVLGMHVLGLALFPFEDVFEILKLVRELFIFYFTVDLVFGEVRTIVVEFL